MFRKREWSWSILRDIALSTVAPSVAALRGPLGLESGARKPQADGGVGHEPEPRCERAERHRDVEGERELARSAVIPTAKPPRVGRSRFTPKKSAIPKPTGIALASGSQ